MITTSSVIYLPGREPVTVGGILTDHGYCTVAQEEFKRMLAYATTPPAREAWEDKLVRLDEVYGEGTVAQVVAEAAYGAPLTEREWGWAASQQMASMTPEMVAALVRGAITSPLGDYDDVAEYLPAVSEEEALRRWGGTGVDGTVGYLAAGEDTWFTAYEEYNYRGVLETIGWEASDGDRFWWEAGEAVDTCYCRLVEAATIWLDSVTSRGPWVTPNSYVTWEDGDGSRHGEILAELAARDWERVRHALAAYVDEGDPTGLLRGQRGKVLRRVLVHAQSRGWKPAQVLADLTGDPYATWR